jgi:3-phosphoshikimate 1-carboxyvinyltransferase
MTIAALAQFGVDVLWQDAQTLLIKGGQSYMARESWVEGDYSNAAFFEALNVFGGEVEVRGLDPRSIQGDKAYQRMFEQLRSGKTELSIADCPDLGPVLFAAAGICGGGTFTGTSRLRIKESDRIATTAALVRALGGDIEEHEDGLTIHGTKCLTGGEVQGAGDHRIVMSAAVAALRADAPVTIIGAEAVKKSYPRFFDTLTSN